MDLNEILANKSNDTIKHIKNKFKTGMRVKLINMVDEKNIEPGSTGTVTHVDDVGTIHVNWDNGRVLGLIYNEDKFEIIK